MSGCEPAVAVDMDGAGRVSEEIAVCRLPPVAGPGAALGTDDAARFCPLSVIAFARFDETGKSEVSGGCGTGLVAIRFCFLLECLDSAS